jgi:hypothetical protein
MGVAGLSLSAFGAAGGDMDLLELGRHLNRTRQLLQQEHEQDNATLGAQLGAGPHGGPGNLVGCISSSLMAAMFAAWFGVYTYESVGSCSAITFDNSVSQKICAVDALYAAGAVSWMGSFISYAVSDCSSEVNLGARCAGGTLGLVGALARVGATGTSASITCSNDPGTFAINQLRPDYFCGLDITAAIIWILQGVAALIGSLGQCGALGTTVRQARCAEEILRTIAAWMMGGGAIANAVSDCPPGDYDLQALCAADIMECIGSVSWMGGSAVVMSQACAAVR